MNGTAELRRNWRGARTAAQPVGASQPRCVDVRLVSATDRPLAVMIADRRFRDDLYCGSAARRDAACVGRRVESSCAHGPS